MEAWLLEIDWQTSVLRASIFGLGIAALGAIRAWRGVPRHVETRLFSAQAQSVYQAAVDALAAVKAKVITASPEKTELTAEVGHSSLFGGGSRITLRLEAIELARTKMVVESVSLGKREIADGGRNKKIILELLRAMEQAGIKAATGGEK